MLNTIHAIYLIVNWVLWLYSLFIVIDAILSWVPMLSDSVIGHFIDKLVNPYLNLFRIGPFARLIQSTGIDVSPIIGLFILYFIKNNVLFWIINILLRIFG